MSGDLLIYIKCRMDARSLTRALFLLMKIEFIIACPPGLLTKLNPHILRRMS